MNPSHTLALALMTLAAPSLNAQAQPTMPETPSVAPQNAMTNSGAGGRANNTYNLNFANATHTSKTLTLGGQTIAFRAYEHIVYVQHPVDAKYERMNIYIPEAYFKGKNIGHFTAQTAPIFMPNAVGGYMPSEPDSPSVARDGHSPNAAFVALSKGYVVATPGARGRTTQDEKGQYTGKAPAAIVDLKAAVRYLRHNDAVMFGNAEKIISNGTSAGGALSALLGASGNNTDYEPYLNALGAAKARDDVFAVSAYCPITNLDHADMAYEWQFNGFNTYQKMIMPQMIDFHAERKMETGALTATQINTSNALKTLFPAYLNALKLTQTNGQPLTLDAQGNGPFKDLVKSYVIASAQTALDNGTDLSPLAWVHLSGKKVTDIDYDGYIQANVRMKTPPAFDALDLSSGENDLFGTANTQAQHFTAFGMSNSAASGTHAAPATVNMMNAMHYLSSPKSSTISTHWRIRHGTADRDTSLAIPVILATTLKNQGKRVDFAMPWNVPHSGDYDLDGLFAWADTISH